MSSEKKKSSEIVRQDRAGHLDPAHAASLLAKGQENQSTDGDSEAFISGKKRAKDSLAQELAEEAVVAMTSGEEQIADDRDRPVAEEAGGPFVRTSKNTELAGGSDESNPDTATREPFPKT